MTKFEDLSEAIAKKKSYTKGIVQDEEQEEDLEVAGSESTKAPLITPADDDQDGSIVDELYKPRHKALMGEFAERWD